MGKMSSSGQADGPSVVKLTNNGSTNVLIVILVIVIILLLALCFIFVQCRRTKRGPEMGIRFTNIAFGVGQSTSGNEWDDPQVTVDRSGTSVGFSNPRFQYNAAQKNE